MTPDFRFTHCALAWGLLLCASTSTASTCPSTEDREVRFTATEGSQMNLDVSPDGKWLVFDLLGDIYILPIAGGKATRLRGGSDWDSRPVWSPDGTKIAFLSDRAGDDHVFVIDSRNGNNLRQITFNGEFGPSRLRVTEGGLVYFEWMPDSQGVVAGGKIFPVERGNGTRHPAPINLPGEVYYGNGTGLYYFSSGAEFRAAQESLPHQAWKLEAWKWSGPGVSTRLPELDVQLKSSYEPPAVSPDARWVVYLDESPNHQSGVKAASIADLKYISTLRVYDAKKKVERVLIGPRSARSSNTGDSTASSLNLQAPTRYAISPDSRHLFAAYGGRINRIELVSGRRRVIPMSVNVEQCLAPMAKSKIPIEDEKLHVKAIRSITQSPDGRHLVFSALRQLYVQQQPNGVPHVLHPQAEGQFDPAYSPDGRWIAYVTWSEVQGGHLWRVMADGSRAEQLTRTPGYYQAATWSPDGEEIAFLGSDDLATQREGTDAGPYYGGNIYLLSLKSRATRQLAAYPRLGTRLSFSKSGKRIYFTPFNNWPSVGAVKLSSIGVDGSAERDEKVDRFFKETGLNSAIISPDGSTLAAVHAGNVYVVHCPLPDADADADALRFMPTACRRIRVTREGGNDPAWREGGRVLEWSFAGTYFRAQLSDLLLNEGETDVSGSAAIDRLSTLGRLETARISLIVPRRRPSDLTALTGGTLITMRDNEVIEAGTVIIRNGRIEQIGPATKVQVPPGARVIDVSGKTLMPGLIDAHYHNKRMPQDLLARNHWEPLVNLSFGVTTVRNPSNGGDQAYSYAELIETGDMVGPRMFSAYAFVSTFTRPIDSIEDAFNLANRYKRLGATFLKYHTGFNRWARRWLHEAAKSLGLNFSSHLIVKNYTTGRIDLSAIVDGTTSSEHQLSGTSVVFGDVRQFLIQSGVMVCHSQMYSQAGYPARYWDSIRHDSRIQTFYRGAVPTENASDAARVNGSPLPPLDPESEAQGNLLAEIAQAGDQVMIGSHGDTQGIGMHLEMWAHVRTGMTPRQVLRAATLNGARGIGVDDDLGSLEPGKLADILVLRGNPLADIRNTLTIETVIKGGIARDAGTLDELWPSQQPLPQWQKSSHFRNSSN